MGGDKGKKTLFYEGKVMCAGGVETLFGKDGGAIFAYFKNENLLISPPQFFLLFPVSIPYFIIFIVKFLECCMETCNGDSSEVALEILWKNSKKKEKERK
jgi:hypothetical protein